MEEERRVSDMKNLAIFLADGFEEIEGLAVVDLCRRAGLTVTMAAIGASLTVNGSHGIRVEADALLENLDFNKLDMLILPGGKLGTQNLEACGALMEKVDAFFEGGKYVAAICAAPSILGHRGILEGRRACCYPGFEEQLKGADVVYEPAVTAGNVITGRGMGCSIHFALKIIEVCCGQERAEQIAKQVVFPG